jgi:3-deoxy-D-manno-octulosonic acid kinase
VTHDVDPDTARYIRLTLPGARLTLAPELAGWAESAVAGAGRISRAAAGMAGARPLRGRGTVWDVPSPVGRVVVRPYLRGGLLAPLARDRYAAVGVSRPVRELRIAVAARDRGIPTPEPLVAAVYPGRGSYAADLVTRLVPEAQDLAAVLFGPAQADARLAACLAAGRCLRRLHDAGLRHPDLNLKNLLLQRRGAGWTVHVIDLDRARLGAPAGGLARRRMVRRFFRSLDKWEARTGRAVPAAERDAILDGYEAAAPPR